MLWLSKHAATIQSPVGATVSLLHPRMSNNYHLWVSCTITNAVMFGWYRSLTETYPKRRSLSDLGRQKRLGQYTMDKFCESTGPKLPNSSQITVLFAVETCFPIQIRCHTNSQCICHNLRFCHLLADCSCELFHQNVTLR